MESQFGHLFFIPEHIDMSLMTLWMLRCREVVTRKNKEIWFIINGVAIHYSLMEHALISELNYTTYPKEWETIGSDNFDGRESKV